MSIQIAACDLNGTLPPGCSDGDLFVMRAGGGLMAEAPAESNLPIADPKQNIYDLQCKFDRLLVWIINTFGVIPDGMEQDFDQAIANQGK